MKFNLYTFVFGWGVSIVRNIYYAWFMTSTECNKGTLIGWCITQFTYIKFIRQLKLHNSWSSDWNQRRMLFSNTLKWNEDRPSLNQCWKCANESLNDFKAVSYESMFTFVAVVFPIWTCKMTLSLLFSRAFGWCNMLNVSWMWVKWYLWCLRNSLYPSGSKKGEKKNAHIQLRIYISCSFHVVIASANIVNEKRRKKSNGQKNMYSNGTVTVTLFVSIFYYLLSFFFPWFRQTFRTDSL